MNWFQNPRNALSLIGTYTTRLVTSASVEGHISKNMWTTQIVLDGNKKQKKKKKHKGLL